MTDDKTIATLKDTSIKVKLAVGICSLIANLFASGVTLAVIGDGLGIAKGGSAGLGDYVKFLSIFFTTAPIVIAVFVSGIFLMQSQVRGYPLLTGLALIWIVAGNISYAVWVRADPEKIWINTTNKLGNNPFGVLFHAILWALAPYGVVLALQGLVIGAIALWVFRNSRERVRVS